jgi:hypothetical protein
MVDLPVSQLMDTPLAPAVQRRVDSPERIQDMGLTASMFTTWNAEDFSVNVASGNPSALRDVRGEIDAGSMTPTDLVNSTAGLQTPAATAANLQDFFNKREQWLDASDGLFLEQVLTLNDPTINAETTRFATNLQVAQELFTNKIGSTSGDTGAVGMVTDFIDRYVLRAVIIGGWEQMFNRNEVKGADMLNAAATMNPTEYSEYIGNYIQELDSEGFFKSDNYFAFQDGLLELENRGENPQEAIDRLFGLVDVIPVVGSIAKVGSIMRSSTALTRAAAIAGPDAATELGARILRGAPNNPPAQVVADMGPSALSPNTARTVVRPTASRSVQIGNENRIVRGIRALNRDSFLGVGAGGDVVQAALARTTSLLRNSVNNPLVDIGPPLRMGDTGLYSVDFTLGTIKTGSPYRTERAAVAASRKLLDDFPTATTAPVDPSDLSKGYYVKVQDNLDLGKEAPELSTRTLLNPVSKLYARLLGSKATVEDELTNTLATLAEGGVSAIGRLVKPQVKALNRLGVSSKDTLSKIMGDLRDGEFSSVRHNYSQDEFADKWRAITGKAPTTKDYEGFQALRDINDAAWMMRTHQRMQKYVARGYYGLVDKNGQKIAGKVTGESVSAKEMVVNLSTGSYLRLGDLPKSTKVWKLDQEIDGMQYAVRPVTVKALSPEDVLGYNAGGRRINPQANNFVTSGTTKPRAFLATFSEKQASEVVDFFRELRKLDLTDTRRVDDFIQNNNAWNPAIQSLDELVQFATQKGFKITDDINFKSRDGEIRTGEIVDDFSETWGEYVTFGMKRNDDVLTEYGGREAIQRDPVTAIFDDFSSITNQYTSNLVVQQGIEGWLKAARRTGSGWDLNAGTLDSRKAFMDATLKESSNSVGLELELQRNILLNRMRVKTDFQRRMDSFGVQARDYVFDKTSLKPANDFGMGEAANKLLTLGFQSAFGFFNAAQVVVQGFHAPVIAAMAPRHGVKGMAMVPAVRLALMAGDSSTEILAVKRMAKFNHITEEDGYELMRYIQITGRDMINESALENGTATQHGLSGWKGESALPSSFRGAKQAVTQGIAKGLDAATIAFKEGDRIARLTGINTAFLEFKAANPGVSALSEYGMRQIRRREEALTLRMTNVNRASIQEGAMKLPTQWMSHSLRILENVIVGRDLTIGERARLVAMYVPFFGLTGMGFAKATDMIGEQFGVEPDSNTYTFLKYGIIDTLLGYGDVDLALANRMAPITFFSSMYKDVTGDSSALAVALGPSGSIASGFIDQTVAAAGDLFTGNTVAMTNDVVRLMRQFTGIDNVAKAWGIYNNGVYRSRTGSVLPFELDTSDAIGQLLGFTPAEVAEWYQEKSWSYNASVNVRDFQTTMLVDWQQAIENLDGDNPERGLELMREIDIRIELSGFSEYDKTLVRGALRERGSTDIHRVIMDRIRRDQGYRAQVLESTFRGEQ